MNKQETEIISLLRELRGYVSDVEDCYDQWGWYQKKKSEASALVKLIRRIDAFLAETNGR